MALRPDVSRNLRIWNRPQTLLLVVSGVVSLCLDLSEIKYAQATPPSAMSSCLRKKLNGVLAETNDRSADSHTNSPKLTSFKDFGLNLYRSYVGPSELKGELLKAVDKIIDRSTRMGMARRTWSKKFLRLRFEVARILSDRSEYLAIHQPKTKGSRIKRWGTNEEDPIVATIGLTTARYKNPNDLSEKLGLEISLKGVKVNRPAVSGGGIVMELRAFWKDKRVSDAALASLWDGTYEMIFNHIKDLSPELYDQDIIYAYADRASLAMYGPNGLGFHVVEDIPPIKYEGTTWRVIAISPRNIKRISLEKRWGLRAVQLHEPVDLPLPGGLRVQASARSTMMLGVVQDRDSFSIEIDHEQDLGNNIWAGPGASVSSFNKNGDDILGVTFTSRPYLINWLNALIPDRASLIFKNGKIDSAWVPGREFEIRSLGIKLGRNARIRFNVVPSNNEIEYFVTEDIAEDVLLNNQLLAKKGDGVIWKRDLRSGKITPNRIIPGELSTGH